MPEYLAPGVYVEEYDADPQPIPGVATSIDDATARALIERFKDLVPPDWTGFNESDPGVTLTKLVGWLAESQLYRADAVGHARRDAALRALLPLLAYGPLVRPRFSEGQLLDAATLRAEQSYQRDKLRRHNLALLGFGVVSGLGVQVQAGDDGPLVVVDPGCAVDALGDEHVLRTCVALRLPPKASEAFVSLRGWDRPFAPVPTSSGSEDTRIEETCVIAISKCLPATAVPLAHLLHDSAGWEIDSKVKAPVIRSRCEPK